MEGTILARVYNAGAQEIYLDSGLNEKVLVPVGSTIAARFKNLEHLRSQITKLGTQIRMVDKVNWSHQMVNPAVQAVPPTQVQRKKSPTSMVIPRKWLHTEFKPDAWKGQRAFILCSGPSLEGFNYDRLDGEKVITINRSVEEYPKADIVYSNDHDHVMKMIGGHYGEASKKIFAEFKGVKLMLEPSDRHLIFPFDVVYVERGKKEFSFRFEDGMSTIPNSGIGALNLAVLLGANPIYLLGMDFKTGANGKTHCHSGYATKQDLPKKFKEDRDRIALVAGEIEKRGYTVVNLNPDSGLDTFPKGKIGDVLKVKRRIQPQPIGG